jgi:hypothetical protein
MLSEPIDRRWEIFVGYPSHESARPLVAMPLDLMGFRAILAALELDP